MNRFGILAALVLAGAAGCYDTGDLGDAPFKCTVDFPECPDGYECDGKLCRKAGSSGMTISITKTGSAQVTMDPALDPSNCPDRTVEPNNDYGSAVPINDSAPQENLAICTSGDIDVFHGVASSQYVRVTIEYLAKSGDLDLARLDNKGGVLEADGSARDNACISTNAPVTGDVWIGVIGANNKDRNRYKIEMKYGTSKMACPIGS